MVVAVGLTLVEPLADVDVKVPGVMAILVAPVVTQLRVLLAPEFMPVGFAEKEVIVGLGPFPGDEVDVPQSTTPAQASRMKTSAQRSGLEEMRPQEPALFLENELVKPKCKPPMLLATPITAASPSSASAHRNSSVYCRRHRKLQFSVVVAPPYATME